MARQDVNWPPRVERWRELTTLAVVLAGALALPLVFVHDPTESFRLPKELLFRAEAILLAAVTLAALLLGAPLPRPRWRDPLLLLPLLSFAVMAILTAASTKPALSLGALSTAAATLVIFFATVAAARHHGWIFIGLPLAAAVANSLLVLVEETNLWMPFGLKSGAPHHIQCTALIGNPNEVGSYLGAAAVTALALMAARAGERRWFSWAAAGAATVLVAGLIASRTLTAMIAVGAAALTMLAISSWKNAMRSAAVAAVALVVIVTLVAPLRERAANMARAVTRGEYNAAVSDRFTPFAAAWSMFTDHPLIGVGPGAFAWQYYDYKIGAEARHPSLRGAWNRGINYGEVHNDHLQVLAEGGLAGYVAFVALLGGLASLSWAGAAAASERSRVARRLAMPLAVFWVVLSLAQFPLETTVVRGLFIHLAAVCAAWRNS